MTEEWAEYLVDRYADLRLLIRRTCSQSINGIITRLVDVDKLTDISICGVKIPLK